MNPSSQTRRAAATRLLLHLLRLLGLAVLIALGLLALESARQVPGWGWTAILLTIAAVVLLSLLPLLALLVASGAFWKRALALLLGLLCAAAIAEGGATLYFSGNREGYETLRAQLMGRRLPPLQAGGSLGQPYLLYVPRPGRYGENFHNQQGYRGKAVPMQRTARVARILCLGGSTTYGVGVANPEDAYPAQLERLLARQLPAGCKGVEVINGGLPYGTTAELLTHYHFKFHYFHPDLVIINTGGNEAVLVDPGEVDGRAKYYQPDYSHWRKPLQVPQPLGPVGRLVMHSRFASWLVILLLHGQAPGNSAIERPPGLPPPTRWHPAAMKPGLAPTLADDQLAFTHNLETLVDLCLRDGAKVLLVPFRLAPGLEKEAWAQSELRHERILKAVAGRKGVPVAPFPAAAISRRNWVDDCHLNAAGCREKAQHIAPFARQLLWPSDQPPESDKQP